MVQQLQNNSDLFFTPVNFGALLELWFQAKITIELQPFHDKMAKILYLVTAELWLRRDEVNIYRTLEGVTRSIALRLAEYLVRYISRLMRQAKQLTTPHTKCLLYATYWVRPILAKLLGRPGKIQIPTKTKAPSGPVKTMVNPTAHMRQTSGVIITNRVSALIAWFPARWASQIAPRLIRCNNTQDVSHVYIQSVRSG